jgi:hypothetical protein
LFWYRNEPLPAFSYRTAEQLVSEGRTDELLRQLAQEAPRAAGITVS